MPSRILSHLIALILGMGLGYFCLKNKDELNSKMPVSQDERSAAILPTGSSEISSTENNANQTTDNVAKIAALEELVAAQSRQLAELQQHPQIPPVSDTSVHRPSESTRQLEVLTMDEFEAQTKSQFMNRFRGVAIQLRQPQLDLIKNEFNNTKSVADWSVDYENHISNFIQKTDPNGLQFVDELKCNERMCRLKVTSSSLQDWGYLYRSLTEQPWYSSMTLAEDSGDPNRIVYYITRPSQLDRSTD